MAKKVTQIPKKVNTPSSRTTTKKPIEQYSHKDKERVYIPPVGLVHPDNDKPTGKKTYKYDPHIDPALQFDIKRKDIEDIIDNALGSNDLETIKEALGKLKEMQEPYLNWSGKAERTSFDIPTVSLHVHERIDPRKIIETVKKKNGSNSQPSLFDEDKKNIKESLEFYQHKDNWSNRLICGDSLQVMNSLIEKEGMAGSVQMVYFDPPYGIKYGSNFQPFVNKKEVKDGKDEDLTSEPEMIKAFRDTWELGIHSYLGYIRDRLLLSKDMLHESGSIFVQISDENVHHIREVMDEIFGSENFVSLISFTSTSGIPGLTLSRAGDYIIWYAKEKSKVKYRQLYYFKENEIAHYNLVLETNGNLRNITSEEREDLSLLPKGAKLAASQSLTSQGETKTDTEIELNGKKYSPGSGQHWKTTIEGIKKLNKNGRIIFTKNSIRYLRLKDDFPVISYNNVWLDTVIGSQEKNYVVQTSEKTIQRCLLLCTDPGDLVLDITCGSGTTAFVSEKYGRRWMTCDTSKVSLALTKQRLMTSIFDYYLLSKPNEGIGSGFRYKTVPHITLKSLANDLPAPQETLYDQPFVDTSKVRVSGAFTVEAIPSLEVKSLDEIEKEMENNSSDFSISRDGETLRQEELRSELLNSGIRGKAGQKISFSRVEVMKGTKYIHAEAETKEDKPKKVLICFGQEFASLEQTQVERALQEAMLFKPDILLFGYNEIDSEASKDIDELTPELTGMQTLRFKMNDDLMNKDLKKKSRGDLFWLVGQPDVKLDEIKVGEEKGMYKVTVNGFDYYNTKEGKIESGGTDKIAMWLLDTNYDGRSLVPSQVFFPMAGANEGWSRLAKNLKAEIDEEKIEAYRGTVSLPFEPGKEKRVAVKIIDDRGIESLRVLEVK